MSAEGEYATSLTPIRTSTKREDVLSAIRRALLNGEFKPGQRVKETPLANALGVSRPTVRDAITQLVHEGALIQVPYKGITVAQPTPRDVLDVADVRVVLETFAALHVAAHRDGEGLTNLREALQDHLDALEEGDAAAADETHLALHRTLWEASENQMMMRVWPLVESQIHMVMTFDQSTLSDPKRDAQLHKRLVDVIAGGSEAEISEEVREHILDSANLVVTKMDH